MPVRIGLPRALAYYQHFPGWKTFFECLGAEVVVSPPTTKQLLTSGASRVVAETCLPTKVYLGHVLALAGQVDAVFCPSLRSLEPKVCNCSKFLGLPDLVQTVVPECPEVWDIDIDMNKGMEEFYRTIYLLGRRLTWNPLKIKAAAETAWGVHNEYIETMARERLIPPLALARWGEVCPDQFKRMANLGSVDPDAPTLAVIGHPYDIYDGYVNHNLLTRLHQMGVNVLTPEMATHEDLRVGIQRLVGKPYWTFEDEVVGAGGHFLERPDVEGVIAVVAFGCGPDSVMVDVVQRAAKRRFHKPFLNITIDEHTGEAGLLTRLEAFVDMLRRKQHRRAS